MHFSVVALLLLATSSFVSAVYQPTLATLNANDIHVLQYALILEQLEYTFYSTYQARFTAQDFVAANIGLTATDYSYFNLIRDHELAHVRFLNTTVGVPSATSSCTYNFPVNSVQDYVNVAYILENVGVSAYDGAINNIYSPGVQQAAATIATIEARHTSYISKVNNQIPFPSPFDFPLNSSSVAQTVFVNNFPGTSQPLAQCTFVSGFALPQLYYVYPVQNASDSTQPTPQSLEANDITVLQYALFLEHFEAAFYAYVNSTFTADNFTATFGNSNAYEYVQLIGSHEATHVEVLSGIIASYGAAPLADCTYNFATAVNGSLTNAIAIAAALEATGVGAYDGAVNAINDPTLKEIAATIATVEARHASYINGLAGNAQGPVQGAAGAFDIPLNFTATYGIVVATNLIVSCPAYPTPYSVLLVKPYTNSTFNPNGGAGTTGTVAPTPSPATSGTVAPTPSPATSGTVAPTPSPATSGTVAPTAAPATTGATPTPTPAPATTRAASTTARTSGAAIASASVVVALLVAVAAF